MMDEVEQVVENEEESAAPSIGDELRDAFTASEEDTEVITETSQDIPEK